MRARDGKLTLEDLAAPLEGMLNLESLRLGCVDGRALQGNPVCTKLTVAPPSPLGCGYTLRWPPTPFMATRPGPWCWWLYLWVSLQGRLGQLGGGEQLPTGIPGALLSALLRERRALGKVGAGDFSRAVPQLPPIPIGYFLADGADMLQNQTLGQAWDLLCHHLAVRFRERRGRMGGVPTAHPDLSSALCPMTSQRASDTSFSPGLDPPNLGLN